MIIKEQGLNLYLECCAENWRTVATTVRVATVSLRTTEVTFTGPSALTATLGPAVSSVENANMNLLVIIELLRDDAVVLIL